MISKSIDRYKSGVYKITNLINNKAYIGSSINVYNRKHTHINKLKNNNHHCKHLQNAYNKYGKDNFLFEIIEYCENITEREQYYIDLIKPEYNKRLVAQNNKGLIVSNQTKKKISDTLKENYKNGLIAYNQSHRQKEVEQYDLQGNYIRTFKNPKDAELYIGAILGKISSCCNLKNGVVKGFQWKYKDSNKIISIGKPSSNIKSIKVTNIINNKVKIFNSLNDCKEYFNKGIHKLIGKNKIYKGKYKFEYHDLYKSDELMESLEVGNHEPS